MFSPLMNTHQKAVGPCSECAPRLISSEMFFFSPKIQEKKKKTETNVCYAV